MAKEYDEEIRKLFGDYKRAKSRMAFLERNEMFGKMPEKEETGSESYEITEPELEMVEFLKNIIEKMGIAATLEINKSEENKVYINLPERI